MILAVFGVERALMQRRRCRSLAHTILSAPEGPVGTRSPGDSSDVWDAAAILGPVAGGALYGVGAERFLQCGCSVFLPPVRCWRS